MGTLKIWSSKFIINYTKQIAKEKREQRIKLENQLKIFEKNLDEDDNLSTYKNIKNELDAIWNHIAEDIRIRSKCNWYEHSEKSIKFFMDLEKQWEVQSTIKNFLLMIRKLQCRHIF